MIEKSRVVGETLDDAGGLVRACFFMVTKKGREQLEKEELVLKVRAGPRRQAHRHPLAARKGSGWEEPSASNVSPAELYFI